MQSRVCARVAHPSTAMLRSAVLRQRPIALRPAVFRSLSRLHTSTACRSDDKKYQDLDEILGKPASSFSELVDQLEILIKHPSPPRNYAEALAKEELRRIDSHDLAARLKKPSDTDKDKIRDTSLPLSARPILRQRPRLSRQPMAVNDELYYRDQTRGLVSDGSDVPGEDAQRQKPVNKPLDLDARVRNFEFGIQPLSKEDAANIGITEEQQERRRIWMSKITGYREFRRNMMSVDNVLDIIDRDEAKDDDSSKEDVSVESLYDSLSEFDMHSLAVKEEDIEFENMLRKSWKLDDEDLMSDKKEETGDVPDATSELSHLPSSDSSSSSSKPPDNKRHYHTSRILGDNNRPDTKDNPSAKKVASARRSNKYRIPLAIRQGNLHFNRNQDHRKRILAKQKQNPHTQSSFGSRNTAVIRPKSLIKPLLIHSKKIVSSHFINNAAEIDDDMMPIGMSVSSGDFVDLRLPRENVNTVNSTIHMRTGFVVQKTTGRFHFNIITAEYMLLSAREQGVGFVADGVLFDEKFLKSTGINDDDITRLIEYGKELDEFEDTHGREIVIPEIEAAQALMTTKQIDAGEAMKASGLDEINDVGELTPESGMEDSTVSVLDLKNNYQSEDTHAEEDGGESFADFMFRVVPTVSRHFKEQADALLLSHFREIKGYYRMAIRNKQKQVTVDSLARLIFGQKANSPDTKKDSDNRPNHIARFAAYMHMINDPVHYIPNVHVFYSCTFELRDPKEVKEILEAKDMVRKQSSEFKDFVEIAQKLVSFSYSHKLDSPLRRSLDADIEAIQKSLQCQITGWKHTGSLAERKIPCDPVPSRQEIDAIRFNESSQLFIRILSKYVFYKNNGYANILNPYWFVVSPILKKMGVYGNTDMASVIRFLVDIGVWPTWFSPSANIRKYPYGDFAKGTDIRRLAETAEAVSDRYLQGLESSDDKVKTNTPVPDMGGVSDFVTPVKEHVLTTAMDGKRVFKASEFYDHDICKAIRHDFGDMPVYTIDSSDTRDVDDGVSIEKIKGPDGNFKTWLHIHIADPTALIHPGHIITESAIRSPQSIYIPEMTINMIPKNLLEAKLSLGSRSKGMPTYTMTFSVCLSDDGNIAEYKVQPGVVHNITAVPYDVLDQFADFNLCNHVYSSFEDIQSKKRHSTFIHPFMKEDSDSFENIGDPSKLPTRVVPDLLSMQKVAMCHFRYRVGQGSFTRVLTELDIEVGHDGRMEQPGPDIGSVPAFLSSRFTADKYDWKMFPKIKSVSDLHSYTPSHVFVGELMIMAGRVAAKFCHDRRLDVDNGMSRNSHGVITSYDPIPLIYRSQKLPNFSSLSGVNAGMPSPFEGMSSEDSRSSTAVWNEVIKISQATGGVVPKKYFDEVRHMLNPSIISTTPGPHAIMGIHEESGYARITSPLRRAEDLINHWQIKAQLLAEHTSSRDKQPWYWSREAAEATATKIYYALVNTSKFSSICTESWAHTLLQRMEYLARRGKLEHPPSGFYDPKSPYYQDTPWAYYNPQKPGPLVWTATVDNRSELRPFISLVIDNIAIRAMLVPRPIDQEKLPFAGTKVRVQVIGVEPHRQMLIVKLAPEELQPAETPRFWDSKHAVNYLTSELSHLQLLP